MRTYFLPTVALVCVVPCGCARDTDRARDAARNFLSAMNRHDMSAAQAVATHAARPNLATFLNESKPSQKGFTLGETQITEDVATVPVTLMGDEPTKGSVLLRREEKEWRVYALRLELRPGNAITVDFEHPESLVGEAFAAMGKELGKGMEEAGRAFGQALGGFAKGFTEGVEKSSPSVLPSDPR